MIAQSLMRASYYTPCKTGELVQSAVSTINRDPYANSLSLPSPDDKHMYHIRGGYGTGWIGTGPIQNWVMKLDVLKYSINSSNGELTYSSTKIDTVPGQYPWYPSACEFSQSGGNLYVVLHNNYNSIVLSYSRNLTNGELTLVSTSPQFSGLAQLNFILLKSFAVYVMQPGIVKIYTINTTDGGLSYYPTTITTNFSQPYAVRKAIISPDSKYMYVVRSNNGLNIFAFSIDYGGQDTFIAVSLVDTVALIDSAETIDDMVWCKKDDLVYVITNRGRIICYQWEYTTGRLIFKYVNNTVIYSGYDNRIFVSSSPEENLYIHVPVSGKLITFKRTKNSGEVNALYTTQQFLAYDQVYFSKNSNFVYTLYSYNANLANASNIIKTYKRTACQLETATICHPISGQVFKNGVSEGVFVFREVYQYNEIARFTAFSNNLNQYWKIVIGFRYPSPGSPTVYISLAGDMGSSTTGIDPGCNTTGFATNSGGVINFGSGSGYNYTVIIQWSEPRPLIY